MVNSIYCIEALQITHDYFFFYDTKTRNVQATSASVTQLVFARGVCFLKNRSNIRKNTA